MKDSLRYLWSKNKDIPYRDWQLYYKRMLWCIFEYYISKDENNEYLEKIIRYILINVKNTDNSKIVLEEEKNDEL
ncbi:MAG: hypothetical protein IRZ03_17130 [Acidobacterium ailaaui]|nr:hypothetical protein [Pseudacidobacterium ailaaui]